MANGSSRFRIPSAKSHSELGARHSLLVIGYGSTLHSDDAAGQRVAEAVAQWNLPQVRAITATQLTPEMAEGIAQADNVVFVDAALRPIKPHKPQRCFGLVRLHSARGVWGADELGRHYGDPHALLALAKSLYGRSPRAWLITIPGHNFELGETLSPLTQLGVSQALAHIRPLVERKRRFVCYASTDALVDAFIAFDRRSNADTQASLTSGVNASPMDCCNAQINAAPNVL